MTQEKLNRRISSADLPRDAVHVRLESLQEELKKNPKNTEVRSQIASLRRELNRAKQFTDIKKPLSEEIIGGRGFDGINADELLKIDKEEWERWIFLSKTFLYKQTKDTDGNIFEEAIDGKELNEWDTFLVDFWKNESANKRIGLGHMLPVSVEYVKVNGKIGVRTIMNNRVGYYESPSPKWYIPVFTGDTVTIPTKTEIETFTHKIQGTGLTKNIDQKATDEANDAYIEQLENQSPETVEINSIARESYDFWRSKNFPHHVAAAIVANEYKESTFNSRAKNEKEDAYGIFQWRAPRRAEILSGYGKDIKTLNHKEQLEAAYWELSTKYSTVMQALIKSNNAWEAAKIFAEQYEWSHASTINARISSAESYAFLLDPDNRSYNLWDHVVRRWPANTWRDSCGAAVRELLKSYGITGLPESGAHGKTWNETLDKMPDKFVRIKINHPREAYAGAILVFDGGKNWSDMNQEYGHVEIKWSDGRYYSYYASENPAGSARTKESDPKKYKELTGFTGYAYYPRQKA